jgi:hypothetical protein
MPNANLERRVAILEENMKQFGDVPAKLTALDTRFAGVELRLTGVESQIVQLRGEMHGEFSAVRSEMRTLNEGVRTEMRVLHEDVVARIALLQEAPEKDRRRRVAPRSRRKKP